MLRDLLQFCFVARSKEQFDELRDLEEVGMGEVVLCGRVNSMLVDVEEGDVKQPQRLRLPHAPE